jgi:hypothetical protein
MKIFFEPPEPARAWPLSSTGSATKRERGSSLIWAGGVSLGFCPPWDGNRERTFLVLHTDDECDVLVNLGKKSRSQTLATDGGRAVDRHDCDGGDTVRFDMTIPHAHRNHRLPGPARGTLSGPKRFSKRGARFLFGGLVGGALLVAVMSFGLGDWTHLAHWLSGLAVLAIAGAYVFGMKWLLGRAMPVTRQKVQPAPRTEDADGRT